MYLTVSQMRLAKSEFSRQTRPGIYDYATELIEAKIAEAESLCETDLSSMNFSIDDIRNETPNFPPIVLNMNIFRTGILLYQFKYSAGKTFQEAAKEFQDPYDNILKSLAKAKKIICHKDSIKKFIRAKTTVTTNKKESDKVFGNDPLGGTGHFSTRQMADWVE